MRSFLAPTIALASILAATPLATAYAAGHSASLAGNDDHTTRLDEQMAPVDHGARLTTIRNDLQGIDQGIADARHEKRITPGTARSLRVQASTIGSTAERIARADHGRVPNPQYRKLMGQLDNLDQALLTDTGSGFPMSDHAGGMAYPNG
jgi:hypothetical protein